MSAVSPEADGADDSLEGGAGACLGEFLHGNAMGVMRMKGLNPLHSFLKKDGIGGHWATRKMIQTSPASKFLSWQALPGGSCGRMRLLSFFI